MKVSFVLTFLFFISYYSFGQQFDLNICNGIQDTQGRTACLKNSLDNLILKELERNFEILQLEPGVPEKLDLEIMVSTAGNFSIASITTQNFAIARAVNLAISSIKPLPRFEDEEGNIIKSLIVFSNTYTVTPDNKIQVKDLLKNRADIMSETLGSQTEEDEDVPFAVIETVPVFPGCDGGDNKAKKKCMSDAIDQYVKENFNHSLLNTLELAEGRHRMYAQFKINNFGYIVDVIARAPHPYLEEEMKRVILSLPKMKAGIQKGKEVNVMYSLPIVFQIEDDSPKEKIKKRKKS